MKRPRTWGADGGSSRLPAPALLEGVVRYLEDSDAGGGDVGVGRGGGAGRCGVSRGVGRRAVEEHKGTQKGRGMGGTDGVFFCEGVGVCVGVVVDVFVLVGGDGALIVVVEVVLVVFVPVLLLEFVLVMMPLTLPASLSSLPVGVIATAIVGVVGGACAVVCGELIDHVCAVLLLAVGDRSWLLFSGVTVSETAPLPPLLPLLLTVPPPMPAPVKPENNENTPFTGSAALAVMAGKGLTGSMASRTLKLPSNGVSRNKSSESL